MNGKSTNTVLDRKMHEIRLAEVVRSTLCLNYLNLLSNIFTYSTLIHLGIFKDGRTRIGAIRPVNSY